MELKTLLKKWDNWQTTGIFGGHEPLDYSEVDFLLCNHEEDIDYDIFRELMDYRDHLENHADNYEL